MEIAVGDRTNYSRKWQQGGWAVRNRISKWGVELRHEMETVWVKLEREAGCLTAHKAHQPIARSGPAALDKESVLAIWGVHDCVRAEVRHQVLQSPSHPHHHQLRLVGMMVSQNHRSQKGFGVLENGVGISHRLEFEQEFVQHQRRVAQDSRLALVACAPPPLRPVVCYFFPSCPFLSSSCQSHLPVWSPLQALQPARLRVPQRSHLQWSVHFHRLRQRRRPFSEDQGPLVVAGNTNDISRARTNLFGHRGLLYDAMHAKGGARTASKAFSMMYNGNARCRGEQVLRRWNDIVESTSPIPVIHKGCMKHRTYSTDIHTKYLNGIVVQRKISLVIDPFEELSSTRRWLFACLYWVSSHQCHNLQRHLPSPRLLARSCA